MAYVKHNLELISSPDAGVWIDFLFKLEAGEKYVVREDAKWQVTLPPSPPSHDGPDSY